MTKQTTPLSQITDVHVEIGFQCNLRCIMCFQKNYTQQMDEHIWKEKMLPLYKVAKRIIIQGGEPTIIPQARELAELALTHNKDIKFGVMSNGLLFGPYWQELFVDHGYMANFSLNGASKEVHEQINKHSNFEKVMHNLNSLIALKKEQGSNLEISTSFVIIPENAHQLSAFIEQGVNLGVQRIRFFFDVLKLPENTQDMMRFVTEAFAARKKYAGTIVVEGLVKFYQHYCHAFNLENIFEQEQEEGIAIPCKAPWSGLYIDHYGNVSSCCMSNIMLGDITKEPLEDIINNRYARAFRARMKKGDYRYCQAKCLSNIKPVYGFHIFQLYGFFKKFISEFRRSPRVAIKKVYSKFQQLSQE